MNPLDNLKDIHTPTEIGFWPLAYGWWLVILLVFVLFTCLVIWAIKLYKLSAKKRQALKELALINNTHGNGKAKLNQLLKRAAISYFPNIKVQQLHGDDWVNFLNLTFNRKHNQEFNKNIMALQQSLYQKVPSDDFDVYKQATSDWLSAALPPKKSTLELLEHKHA
ncbi:DUF4381 domain-containing protein [Paraglaciecola sp. 2405UD69-4]|uniref:DUF4381 domain-containing protein n=1 Tax=Paraglaciecola sp. 2405UD69-4 TaxID=3391836 RepID=UPI0039C9E2B8